MSAAPRPPQRPVRLVAILVSIVVGMTALALSAAPLYDAFCRITGYGGTTQKAVRAPGEVLDETIEVRFDVNVPPGTPLEFKADQTVQTLRIGETGLAFFTVRNMSDKVVHAQAGYNVTPHQTGIYFQKLQCFCFKERVFQPHEVAQLPVIFYVDPGIVRDRNTYKMRSITLSYTYYGQISS